MTTSGDFDAVAFVEKHRAHFEEVERHNMDVTIRRHARGADWSLPENQYRNAWAELGAE